MTMLRSLDMAGHGASRSGDVSVHRVVMFSGGVGSWLAARRVADAHGTDGLVLLFADTLMEDEDLHRFLDDAARNIGVPVTAPAPASASATAASAEFQQTPTGFSTDPPTMQTVENIRDA